MFKVIRDEKKPYVMIRKDLIQNSSLSIGSRMLLIYCLSFDDEEGVNTSLIRSNLGVGRNKLEKMFRELREAGYVKNIFTRNSKGFSGSRIVFSDSPEFLTEKEAENG